MSGKLKTLHVDPEIYKRVVRIKGFIESHDGAWRTFNDAVKWMADITEPIMILEGKELAPFFEGKC